MEERADAAAAAEGRLRRSVEAAERDRDTRAFNSIPKSVDAIAEMTRAWLERECGRPGGPRANERTRALERARSISGGVRCGSPDTTLTLTEITLYFNDDVKNNVIMKEQAAKSARVSVPAQSTPSRLNIMTILKKDNKSFYSDLIYEVFLIGIWILK